jgi:hypothetical protein
MDTIWPGIERISNLQLKQMPTERPLRVKRDWLEPTAGLAMSAIPRPQPIFSSASNFAMCHYRTSHKGPQACGLSIGCKLSYPQSRRQWLVKSHDFSVRVRKRLDGCVPLDSLARLGSVASH